MTDNRILWDWGHIQEQLGIDRAYMLNDREVNFLFNVAPKFEWASRWFNIGVSTDDERSAFGHDIMYKLMTPIEIETGVGSLGECFRMDTSTEVFEFYPNNPFLPDGDFDAILSGLKWVRWADLPINNMPVLGNLVTALTDGATGYFPNDCFVTLDDQALLDTPLFNLQAMFDLMTSPTLPMVTIKMKGAGQLEVELVQSPLGGSFVLIPDIDISLSAVFAYILDFFDSDGSMPSAWQVVEVNRDILALPPELIVTQISEFEFVGDTDHTLTAIFVPRINDEFPYFNPFGGIREIEACGSLRVVGAESGDEFNFQNFRNGNQTREGVIMATQEEIRWGVHHGIYDVMLDAIAGHGDGVTSNIRDAITIDKDGDVSVDKSGSVQAVEFSSTTAENMNGGAYNQAVQFAKLFTDMDVQIVATYSDNLIIKSLQYVMRTAEILVFSVSAYRITAVPVVIDVLKLAESIYCTGSFASGLFAYASNPATHSEDDLLYILDMASDVSSDALSQWYTDGKASPLTLYTGYGCYRLPGQHYTFNTTTWLPNNTTLYSGSLLSRKYRVEIDVVEPMTNALGDRFDGVYWHDVGFSANTNHKSKLNGSVSPLVTPPYLDGAGKYILEYNVPNYLTYVNFNNVAIGTVVSGKLVYSIYDLGEY